MTPHPQIVDKISQAVSIHLGREATVRKVKNINQYFILDLAFSYFQKADRNRRNDYRSGYLYYKDENNKNCLLFTVTHTPIMFSFLLKNFNYPIFREIVTNTEKFRDEHLLIYKNKDVRQKLVEENLNHFLQAIDTIETLGFSRTVFSKNNSSGKGIGNVFSFGIARGFEEKDVVEIIALTWDLFLWLYPSKPLFNRDASLNRNLRKLERKCEITAIQGLPSNIREIPCNGKIEGAHIKPHKLGGSDQLNNGLWLCNMHHRLTEGKISGNRTIKDINVVFNR